MLLIPFPKRAFAGSPPCFLGEEAAADAAAVVVPLITERTDFEASLQFRSVRLLQAVGHVGCQCFREVGGHLDFSWQSRLVARVSTEHGQAVVRLRVRDDGPVRILIHKSPQRRQQTGATILAVLAKDLRVVQYDSATDIARMPMKFIRQLVSRVTSIDEQQIALFDIDRQRICEDERKLGRSLPLLQYAGNRIVTQVIRDHPLGLPGKQCHGRNSVPHSKLDHHI